MNSHDPHLVITSVHSMKMCCALGVASGNYRGANQTGKCTQCGNTLIAKISYDPLWGDAPKNPNDPQKLAKGVGVFVALYSGGLWTETRVERDLNSRGLAPGVQDRYLNNLVVLERPLDWMEPGTLALASPSNASGIHFLVGKVKPEYAERSPTDAELHASIHSEE